MVRGILISLFSLAGFVANSQTLFSKTFGGERYDHGRSIIETHDSLYVMCGSTSSFNNYDPDVYLIKTDSLGNYIWSRAIGGTGFQQGNQVIETKDSGYAVVGHAFSGVNGAYDALVMRTDSAGNLLWTAEIGGSDWDFGKDIIENNDGTFLITGYTYSNSNGDADMMVAKLSPGGTLLWTRNVGGASSDEAHAIIRHTNDTVYIAGTSESFGYGGSDMTLCAINEFGDSLWCKNYGGALDESAYDMIESVDGSISLFGSTSSFGAGQLDMWLIDVSPQGDSIWSERYGGADDDEGYFLCQNPIGDYFIGGYSISFGTLDGFQDWLMYKVSGTGIFFHGLSYGFYFDDAGHDCVYTFDDALMAVGDVTEVGYGGSDVVLKRIEQLTLQHDTSYTNFNDVLTIVEHQKTDIRIYPNPASETVNIETERPGTLRLFTMEGRMIREEKLNAGNTVINVSDLPKGIFQLTIKGEYFSSQQLFIKQ